MCVHLQFTWLPLQETKSDYEQPSKEKEEGGLSSNLKEVLEEHLHIEYLLTRVNKDWWGDSMKGKGFISCKCSQSPPTLVRRTRDPPIPPSSAFWQTNSRTPLRQNFEIDQERLKLRMQKRRWRAYGEEKMYIGGWKRDRGQGQRRKCERRVNLRDWGKGRVYSVTFCHVLGVEGHRWGSSHKMVQKRRGRGAEDLKSIPKIYVWRCLKGRENLVKI